MSDGTPSDRVHQIGTYRVVLEGHPVTLREQSARLRVPVLVGDEWLEVELCQNTLLVPRPTIQGVLD